MEVEKGVGVLSCPLGNLCSKVNSKKQDLLWIMFNRERRYIFRSSGEEVYKIEREAARVGFATIKSINNLIQLSSLSALAIYQYVSVNQDIQLHGNLNHWLA